MTNFQVGNEILPGGAWLDETATIVKIYAESDPVQALVENANGYREVINLDAQVKAV